MQRFVRNIVLWSALAVLPTSVNGQIIDYTGSLGAQEYMNFVSGSGVASTWTHDGGRVQLGPYVGSFTQSGVTTPQFSLICVDFNHYAGSQTVNVTDIGLGQSDAGLGATRLGSSDGNLGRYRQAAYLASLFDSWESLGYGTDRRTVWSGIHSAIWSLMTLDPIGGTSYALRDQIIDDHGADGLAFSGDGWYLLSPDGNYNGQEMLIRGPASTVPEPSTYLLMATGLLLLAAFGRKRMKQFGEA